MIVMDTLHEGFRTIDRHMACFLYVAEYAIFSFCAGSLHATHRDHQGRVLK